MMRNLQQPGRSPVYAPRAMASTSHPLATSAALDILRQGGNAVDAAIAAVATHCVVEPAMTSVGGDCFCLYAPAHSSTPIALNGSGRAPLGLSDSWLLEHGIEQIEQQTPHSVTVPTAVDAWLRLNTDHGKLPIDKILENAIYYAETGYPVAQRVAFDFADMGPLLSGDEDAAKTFLRDGKPLAQGMAHSQPQLARTLREIAAKGRDGFYKGWVADDILTKLNRLGGLHSQEDFDRAIADYIEPIKTDFRGYDIWECPPNGQGVIALLLMNMASHFDCSADSPITAERLHMEIEAGKLAYRDRGAVLADPSFIDVPVAQMLSKEYAKMLFDKIDTDKANNQLPPSSLPAHRHTVYVSVVDEDRNACSLINTVYNTFGSGIVAPESGVLLQNRGMGFVVQPGHPNSVEPGKRPLHTIIPGIVSKHGKTAMSFGVMGGEYQAFGHMQFLTAMFDYGLDIQQAQDRPRFFPNPFKDEVELETTIPNSIFDALKAKGHNVVYAKKPIGGSQAIWIDPDTDMLIGGSDPRKDGMAAGY